MTTQTQSRVDRAQEALRRQSEDGRERRRVDAKRVEVRQVRDDGSYDFEGHAAVFDELSVDLGDPIFGSFHEVIKRGAFKNVLTDDVWFLFNHNPDIVLARSTSGTLKLSEDPRGLFVEADVAPTTAGKDLRILLERGDVSQMSFGFRVAEDEWFEDADGNVTRTILKFEELFDVSAVVFPAYPQTDAGLRALHKLERGENVTREERAALEGLLDQHSTEPPAEEQEVRADGQEPDTQASEEDAQVVEDPAQTGERISARSARARIAALTG